MSSHSQLLMLPCELRNIIYSMVEEEDDLGSLSSTCRQLRAEILDHLPGGRQIDYDVTTKDEVRTVLEFFSINILIKDLAWGSLENPYGKTLKCEVRWRFRNDPDPTGKIFTARWSFKSPSSPMARYISLFHEYDPNVGRGLQFAFDPNPLEHGNYDVWSLASAHLEHALGIRKCGANEGNCDVRDWPCTCPMGIRWKRVRKIHGYDDCETP